jgi:hypothetical protein
MILDLQDSHGGSAREVAPPTQTNKFWRLSTTFVADNGPNKDLGEPQALQTSRLAGDRVSPVI